MTQPEDRRQFLAQAGAAGLFGLAATAHTSDAAESSEPLRFTHRQWRTMVGERFSVRDTSGELILKDVRVEPHDSHRPSDVRPVAFSLIFVRANGEHVASETHTLSHPATGCFPLFIHEQQHSLRQDDVVYEALLG